MPDLGRNLLLVTIANFVGTGILVMLAHYAGWLE